MPARRSAPAEPPVPPAYRTEGIRCPSCGCGHLPALYTRHHGNRTVRVRLCRHCGRRVTTTEKVQGTPDA